MTNWTSASDKADLLRAASGKQSHHTSDAIQHNKLLKCSPSLKPEDCEFTVKQNNEQARSAYYFTHSCHLPLPRVRDSQLNFTGTYGKYLDTCTCQEYDSLIPPCVCSGGSTSKQHLIFTLSLQCFPSQLRNMSFFKIFFIYLFFLSIRFRPRYCPTLTAMFYNDLVISLDAADLHCISLKLEWDLILLQPCRSAVRKKKKKEKCSNWMPDLFFRWLKCAVLQRFPEQTTELGDSFQWCPAAKLWERFVFLPGLSSPRSWVNGKINAQGELLIQHRQECLVEATARKWRVTRQFNWCYVGVRIKVKVCDEVHLYNRPRANSQRLICSNY